MASRRDKPAADPFGGGEDYDLETVKNALYGDIQQADRERVVRRLVSMREIYVDPVIQVRVEGLNVGHVEVLAQVLLNGGQFRDPIRLFRDEESDRLYLSDGFHRVAAYKRAIDLGAGGAIGLEAEILPGGFAAALADAEEHNLQHGLKLSSQDKFNIFQRRLERDHDWVRTSNRQIAGLLGVDEGTVRNWRAKVFEGSKSRAENSAPQRAKKPETRIGADGKSYPIRPPEARAQPKGLTAPPPQRYVRDEWSQMLPEEPSISYDEDVAAEQPASPVPAPVVDPEPSLPAWMRLSQDAAILSRHAKAVLEVPRAVLDELDDETLAHLGTLMVTTQEAMVTAWDHFQALREYMVEIVQMRMYGEDDDAESR